MRYNQINKIILFGGAPLLLNAALWLKKNQYQLFVYTSPRHAEEVLDDQGNHLGALLKAAGIDYVATEDINTEPSLLPLIDEHTLGIGMGEAWSFNADIIQSFRGRLLDFMGIPHPRYRGGAHYTWMILRGDKQCACNLQVINEEMVQGEFDSGEIVKTKKYRFPESVRIPLDYFKAAVKEEVAFIEEFLTEVKAGKDFHLAVPDESQSLFLPRLNTMQQGWINWNWSGLDVERFICAFDEPYAGASTQIDGRRVHLKEAQLDTSEPPFHPYQSGLITRMTEAEGIVVATTSGHLKIQRVLDEKGQDCKNQLHIGQRFYTTQILLEQAMLYKASYGVKKS